MVPDRNLLWAEEQLAATAMDSPIEAIKPKAAMRAMTRVFNRVIVISPTVWEGQTLWTREKEYQIRSQMQPINPRERYFFRQGLRTTPRGDKTSRHDLLHFPIELFVATLGAGRHVRTLGVPARESRT
jgi:hypothetical protein